MIKHNHIYNGCDHKLKFCDHCDTIYCLKCPKEWDNGRNHHCASWGSIYPYYVSGAGTLYNATQQNTIGGTLTSSTHKHK